MLLVASDLAADWMWQRYVHEPTRANWLFAGDRKRLTVAICLFQEALYSRGTGAVSCSPANWQQR